MNRKTLSVSEVQELVEKTLQDWHVTGLALAVVKDGQVLLCEGYGLRNVARALPVTPHTLFSIASCTKAFTAMAVCLLSEEGRLDLDMPVKEYLPAFKLWDPYATERLTARDLLTHRSGLPGHDLLWYASNFTRRQLFERLRYLQPTCDLRTTFQYQNVMYTVAGLLVEELSGMSWEAFIQSRIFDRLGMSQSNCSASLSQQCADFATPYRYRREQLVEMPFREEAAESAPMGPAGGIYSSASDLLIWLQLQLNHGKIGDQVFISESGLEQMQRPYIFVDDPLERKRFEHVWNGYGLGWELHGHKGQFLVEHDGMSDGFYTLISMIPSAGLGIAALSNGDAYYNPVQDNLAPDVVVYTLIDRLLGLQPTDWNAHLKAINAELAEAMKSPGGQPEPPGRVDAPPSHPIEAYLGSYVHPGYGVVTIRRQEGQLQMVINDRLVLPLEHYRYDIFEALFEIVDARQRISFYTDLDGNIARLSAALEPRVKELIFERS